MLGLLVLFGLVFPQYNSADCFRPFTRSFVRVVSKTNINIRISFSRHLSQIALTRLIAKLSQRLLSQSSRNPQLIYPLRILLSSHFSSFVFAYPLLIPLSNISSLQCCQCTSAKPNISFVIRLSPVRFVVRQVPLRFLSFPFLSVRIFRFVSFLMIHVLKAYSSVQFNSSHSSFHFVVIVFSYSSHLISSFHLILNPQIQSRICAVLQSNPIHVFNSIIK